jgi:hypothetical protein
MARSVLYAGGERGERGEGAVTTRLKSKRLGELSG